MLHFASLRHTMRIAMVIALVLLLLPAGAGAQLPEWPAPANAPRQFVDLLSTLDASRVESVTAARKWLEEGLEVWPPGQAEDAFRAFWDFYRTVVRVHDDAIDRPDVVRLLVGLCEGRKCGYYMLRSLESWTAADVVAALDANRTLLEPARAARRHGVEVIYGEGNLYRAEDAVLLAAMAAKLPRRAFREFVEFYAREQDVWVYDAGIVIPWPTLAERLVRWENFSRTHAELPETSSVVGPEVRRLREFYLCGVSNTPVYGFEHQAGPRTVNPDALASFQDFARRHSESETAAVVREVVRRLAETRGVLDDALRAHLQKALNNDHTACGR